MANHSVIAVSSGRSSSRMSRWCTPAAAAAPTTLVDEDLSGALQWVDLSTPALSSVSLGTGGHCLATLVPMGEMAAMSLRILVGSGASLGTGPWCFESIDMPTGFKSATVPNDTSPAGTPGWGGPGSVTDLTDVNQSQRAIAGSWSNFSNFGLGTLLLWTMPDRHNDGSGSVLLNYNGTVPFGRPLAEGAFVFFNFVYRRDTSED